MSNLYKRKLTLSGLNPQVIGEAGMASMIGQILQGRVHGLGFSPYMDGQNNLSPVSEDQIRNRLSVLAPHTKWIRSFSCTRGNEAAPRIAKELGLKTMVGIWIDDDLERNELEIANGLEIAARGEADILAVGNEVLLREEITQDQLIDYIERVKASVDVPVGYVDAYFQFEDCPRVAEACDVLLVNCYPFWESYPIEHAHIYMREMYRRAVRVAGGKPVIIAETGWPDVGTAEGEAEPSRLNAMKYFIDAVKWAQDEGVDLFYFAGFDEAWKVESEGDVGAFWGLWNKDGLAKYHRT